MKACSTKLKIVILVLVLAGWSLAWAQTGAPVVRGIVLDPVGRPIAGAQVEFESASGKKLAGVTGQNGEFSLTPPSWRVYTVSVEVGGFARLRRRLEFNALGAPLQLRLERIAAPSEQVVVSAGVDDVALAAPDPSERVMVREELLDANPGRPGAPVSIPGLPIETASGGIKAPQYFVPGVAGDHGEPIAQYIAVGDYLLTNNLQPTRTGTGMPTRTSMCPGDWEA